MANQLDLDNPVVTKEGKATAYLEDIIFQLFQAVQRTPVDVTIDSNVATINLALGNQFNILADDDFSIDIIGVEDAVDFDNGIDIINPAGAFDLTTITAPVGVDVTRTDGVAISILGFDSFSFIIKVPSDTAIRVLPFPQVPL